MELAAFLASDRATYLTAPTTRPTAARPPGSTIPSTPVVPVVVAVVGQTGGTAVPPDADSPAVGSAAGLPWFLRRLHGRRCRLPPVGAAVCPCGALLRTWWGGWSRHCSRLKAQTGLAVLSGAWHGWPSGKGILGARTGRPAEPRAAVVRRSGASGLDRRRWPAPMAAPHGGTDGPPGWGPGTTPWTSEHQDGAMAASDPRSTRASDATMTARSTAAEGRPPGGQVRRSAARSRPHRSGSSPAGWTRVREGLAAVAMAAAVGNR